MDLFFAEHAHQVQDLLCVKNRSEGRWIALGPSAMHYLDQLNIPYTIPEDYADLDEIESICKEQFEKVKKASILLDRILLENDAFLREWRIKPFFFHLWQIGMLFDGIISRAWWFKKIMEKVSCGNIYIHIRPLQAWEVFWLSFIKQDTLWGQTMLASKYRAKIQPLEDTIKSNEHHPWNSRLQKIKNKVKDQARSNVLLKSVATSWRIRNLKNIIRLLGINTTQRIWILNNPYEWETIIAPWVSEGTAFIFFNETMLKTGKEHEYPFKQDSDALRGEFFKQIKMLDIDYKMMLDDRIRWIIEKAPSVSYNMISQLTKIYKRKTNPDAILCGATPSFRNNIIKQFFKKMKIPVLGWQYGATWAEKEITQRYHLIDASSANVLLVYGEAVKEAYIRSEVPDSMTIEMIGSAQLDKINKNILSQ